MKDLIERISSYNLFNYLFPGVVFVVFLKEITKYNFYQTDILIGVVVYYIIGLIISRVGSLIIEPTLKRISFLKFADYNDFIKASETDPKIETLSEANNMYRTFCSMLLLLLLFKVYETITTILKLSTEWDTYILIVLLLLTFLFSYKKQTNYITRRVEANRQK